jgi:hypothetical protein
MHTDILDPDAPMTRDDARMISRLADPARGGVAWLEGLTPEHRKALIVRMVVTLEKCRERGTDNDLKIYSRLMGTLARFADIEQRVLQGPRQEQHLHLHGEGTSMTDDEIVARINQLRRVGAVDAASPAPSGAGEPDGVRDGDTPVLPGELAPQEVGEPAGPLRRRRSQKADDLRAAPKRKKRTG